MKVNIGPIWFHLIKNHSSNGGSMKVKEWIASIVVILLVGVGGYYALSHEIINAYRLIQAIVLSYAAATVILVATSFYFEVKCGFKTAQARHEMFTLANKLHGKTKVLLLFKIFSLAALISWVALALPWVDAFNGSYISTLEYGSFQTWFGKFEGKQVDYYFMTVLTGMFGVKGFWVLYRMADILTADNIAVNRMGFWGARRDFK